VNIFQLKLRSEKFDDDDDNNNNNNTDPVHAVEADGVVQV
jgi:hypothetical protein